MFITLSAKNKLDFINDTITPPDLNDAEYQRWSHCNHMITSWLLNSVTKDIKDSVIYSKTSRDLWMSLEHRFRQTSGAKLFHPQKEITCLVRGTLDIAGYFTRLKRLWDELDSLNVDIVCSCVSVCDGQRKLIKSLQDQNLMQFLMGLNEIYSQEKSNILMENPLCTLDYAYSLLLQYENQREMFANAQFPSETASLMQEGRKYHLKGLENNLKGMVFNLKDRKTLHRGLDKQIELKGLGINHTTTKA